MKPLNYSSSSWRTWVRDNENVAKFLLKFHLIPYLIPHTHTHYFQFFLLSRSGRYITSFMILFSLIRCFFPQTLHDATARPLPLTYFSKQPTNQAEPAKVSVKSEKNGGDDGENGFSGVGRLNGMLIASCTLCKEARHSTAQPRTHQFGIFSRLIN